MGEFQDEASVKVAESKEAVNFLDIGWCGPVNDAFHFYRVHFDFPVTNNDAEIVYLLFMEVAFFWFEAKVVGKEFVQEVVDFSGVVFFIVISGNNGVIHVDFQPPLGHLLLEDVVHHGLKCGR